MDGRGRLESDMAGPRRIQERVDNEEIRVR